VTDLSFQTNLFQLKLQEAKVSSVLRSCWKIQETQEHLNSTSLHLSSFQLD
jgi:hypothetical protein